LVTRSKPVLQEIFSYVLLQEIFSYVHLSRKCNLRVNIIWVVAEPKKVVTNLRAKEQR
jgi:hypothetical protein